MIRATVCVTGPYYLNNILIILNFNIMQKCNIYVHFFLDNRYLPKLKFGNWRNKDSRQKFTKGHLDFFIFDLNCLALH